MIKVPQNYIPQHLSQQERNIVRRELKKSRRAYKKGKYYTRKKVKGFKSKRTPWAKRVEKLYGIDIKKTENVMDKLSKVTKCKITALDKIVKKGMGAYYSSGSRPNQTPHSWGYARLYSAISGGPSAKIDLSILKKGCKKTSKALRLAKKRTRIPRGKTIKLGGRIYKID